MPLPNDSFAHVIISTVFGAGGGVLSSLVKGIVDSRAAALKSIVDTCADMKCEVSILLAGRSTDSDATKLLRSAHKFQDSARSYARTYLSHRNEIEIIPIIRSICDQCSDDAGKNASSLLHLYVPRLLVVLERSNVSGFFRKLFRITRK